jgi:3-oxoacyl-[acyl-carrier-protein] synthase II
VVITGVGPLSPIGSGKDAFWDALLKGVSGARPIRFEEESMDHYASKIGCPIVDFKLEDYLERTKETKYFGRASSMALAGAKMALEDAGLPLVPAPEKGGRDYAIKALDSTHAGVILGIGVQNMDGFEKQHRRFLESRGSKRISPFALPYIQVGSIPSVVSKKFGIRGTSLSVSTACASGTYAVIEACKQILLGEEVLFIAGGCDACLTPFVFGGFDALGAMSRRNDDPEKASRPFDRNRDGFVLGEGAGILIVEELKHALDRGGHIYAEILGFGITSDAYHITAVEPSGEMQAKAITDALRMARVRPDEVDYVNAHGTSTLLNDPVETLAIKRALGEHAYHIPVTSTKSMTGHLIGGSGGIEMIATALMIGHGKVHPTINLETPGEGCDLDYVPDGPVDRSIRKALKNSFAFGGMNATVLLSRFEESHHG